MQYLHDLNRYYKDPLYKNFIFIIFSTGLTSIFGFLFWVGTTHILPPDEIGIITGIVSASTFILVASRLGMDTGIMRFLPMSNDKNSLYTIANLITLFISLILAIIFIIGIDIFSPKLGILRQWDVLTIYLLYIILSSVCYMQNVALISSRKAELYFIQNMIFNIRVPLLLITYYLIPSIIGVLIIIDISYLATFLFGRITIPLCGINFTLKPNLKEIRNIWKYSLGGYTSNLFTMMPTSIIPIMIINTIGPTNNAYFFIAYSVASFMTMIPSAICQSLFVEGSHEVPLKISVIKSIKLLLILMVPAFLLILIFGNKLLLLFSSEYSTQSFEILQMLAISSLFSSATLIYISIKKVQKEMGIVNIINSLLSLLVIVIGYFMLEQYGLIGIGYAWLLANITIFVIISLLVIKRDKWISLWKIYNYLNH